MGGLFPGLSLFNCSTGGSMVTRHDGEVEGMGASASSKKAGKFARAEDAEVGDWGMWRLRYNTVAVGGRRGWWGLGFQLRSVVHIWHNGHLTRRRRTHTATTNKSDDGVDEPEHMTADRVSRKGGAKGACGIDAQNGYRLWFARVADTVCLGRSRRLG